MSCRRTPKRVGSIARRIASTPGIVTATNASTIHRAWYNFDIPFTDYQFDPSLEGIKTAAGVVKDAAVAGLEWIVDEITSLVDSGIQWVSERWDGIQKFASSAFNAARDSFTNIIAFIKNPLGFLADAFMSLDAQVVARGMGEVLGIVSTVANGFKLVTDNLLNGVNRIWGGINGFAMSLLNRVAWPTNNFLLKKLPDALQQVAVGFVNRLKSFWKKSTTAGTRSSTRSRPGSRVLSTRCSASFARCCRSVSTGWSPASSSSARSSCS